MEVQKGLVSMKNRLANQLGQALHDVKLEHVLAAVGLQASRPRRGMVLPLLTAFGAGMAAGALLTPMNGKTLRAGIGAFVTRLQAKASARKKLTGDAAAPDSDGMESPYDKASKAQRDGNGEKKNARVGEGPVPT
ncbi:MAG: hypothetical protein U1F43_29510 [Myxococcota bacterium]